MPNGTTFKIFRSDSTSNYITPQENVLKAMGLGVTRIKAKQGWQTKFKTFSQQFFFSFCLNQIFLETHYFIF